MRKLAMLLAALVLGGACSEEIIEPFVMTVTVMVLAPKRSLNLS